jgi:hypothetical protein
MYLQKVKGKNSFLLASCQLMTKKSRIRIRIRIRIRKSVVQIRGSVPKCHGSTTLHQTISENLSIQYKNLLIIHVLVVVWSAVVKPRLQQIQLSVDIHFYAFATLNTVIGHLSEAYPSLTYCRGLTQSGSRLTWDPVPEPDFWIRSRSSVMMIKIGFYP